jgi:nucleoside-diphosphate-sugar epimerase
MARIVLAGATGFLGGHILRGLAGQHEIWCLSRRQGSALPGVTWLETDLAGNTLPARLPDQADVVIHSAQSSHFRDFPQGASDVLAVNVQSAAMLADWALRARVRTMVYVSSGGVYGPSSSPLTEDSPVSFSGPLAFYNRSKYAAEVILSGYAGPLAVIVVRPFFIYGAGQPMDMLMPRLLERVRQGKPITLSSPEGMFLNPVHVEDAARLILRAARLETSALVNLAGPETSSLKNIAHIMGDQFGVEPSFIFSDEPAQHMIADTTRLHALLGRPSITLRDGIAGMMRAMDRV